MIVNRLTGFFIAITRRSLLLPAVAADRVVLILPAGENTPPDRTP